MGEFKTEQESFWAGDFGNDYVDRNVYKGLLESNIAFFARLFRHMPHVSSVVELGANIGMNLRALRALRPDLELSAIEINEKAVASLKQMGGVEIFHQSIIDFSPTRQWDLALIKTVLIHINPEMLPSVYDVLARSSSRYICIAEYYNMTPVEVHYRGHDGKLFKRDFAGELLDRHPEWRLLDYGFCYHRDPNFPQDDVTWFLLERKSA